jgi:hypothetical protein
MHGTFAYAVAVRELLLLAMVGRGGLESKESGFGYVQPGAIAVESLQFPAGAVSVKGYIDPA